MTVHANVVFKNEAILLKHLVEVWKHYPIDEWVFYDDRSTDESVEIVKTLPGIVTVINDHLDGPFHETYCRDRMLEYSRANGAEFVVALDADEFISTNALKEWDIFLEVHKQIDVEPFWYNLVNDVNHIRYDPMYVNNYKSFVMYVPETRSFKEYPQLNIHCTRNAPSNLPKVRTKKYGLMHLQSLNLKYYALKQLWYKHWEYTDLGLSVPQLNAKYDPVVNGLDLKPRPTPSEKVEGIDISADIFEELLEVKQYKKYILDHLVPELVTFGKEYLYED